MVQLTLTDTIIDAFEIGDLVLGVFLDFSKAFNTVNHDILLRKLNFYGIRGVANDWVKRYLADRQQYVNYGGNVSQMYNIECGVPQGSILGPLLFLMYINDLATVSSKLQSVIFADDTNVFIQGRNVT